MKKFIEEFSGVHGEDAGRYAPLDAQEDIEEISALYLSVFFLVCFFLEGAWYSF
jgi:hypothetical protein